MLDSDTNHRNHLSKVSNSYLSHRIIDNFLLTLNTQYTDFNLFYYSWKIEKYNALHDYSV